MEPLVGRAQTKAGHARAYLISEPAILVSRYTAKTARHRTASKWVSSARCRRGPKQGRRERGGASGAEGGGAWLFCGPCRRSSAARNVGDHHCSRFRVSFAAALASFKVPRTLRVQGGAGRCAHARDKAVADLG
eukprot:scaffold9205_cov121-Isochrysis_galbana.AAC.3